MFMLSNLILFEVILSKTKAAEFTEPNIYTLHDDQEYRLKAGYCDIENTEFKMTGRCWSLCNITEGEGECSDATSPGPTLKLIAGTSFTLILENNFVNTVQSESEDECHNSYCEMDKLNVHTHGLHISSSQDDVLVDLKPRESTEYEGNIHTYSYTIPEDHAPGIHWYHPHNHGAVSHQIHFGLFGALITEYPDSTAYDNATCVELYTDGGDTAYKTNIMIFSMVYAVNTELCTCSDDIISVETLEGSTNEDREGAGAYGRCAEHGKDCFHQYSACYEYCAFEGSREGSGLEYNIEIQEDAEDADSDGIDQIGLVNGVYNPTLSITAGKYRRLQFVNTMAQYYIHYKFPEECEILLLGYDGIFFTSTRNLDQFSNELIVSSGGRADLLIKCDEVGEEYQVETISLSGQSQNDESNFQNLERFGSDNDGDDEDQKKLFKILVVEDAGDTIEDAISTFPKKPDYLEDLQNVLDDEVDGNCACNQYGDTGCGIAYSSKDGMHVNGEEFSSSSRYLTYMIQDRIYEFTLKTDRHIHHQHVIPFQLMENIGTNGFIAKAGDWFDTMGAENERQVRMKTADFNGYLMLHCHLLQHEDNGMMALMYVLSEDELTSNTPSPTLSPTDECLPYLKERAEFAATEGSEGSEGSEGGGGGGGKPKKGSSSVSFDFKFDDLNLNKHNDVWISSIILIFMLLTLCNTCMICQSRKGSKIIGNKMYGVVNERDHDVIDGIDDI